MSSLPLDVAAEVLVLRHTLGVAEGHGETSLSSQERAMEDIPWPERSYIASLCSVTGTMQTRHQGVP